MTWKSLIVEINETASDEKAVAAAIDLANRNEAHLVGCLVAAEVSMPGYLARELPEELAQRHNADVKEVIERAKGKFMSAAAALGERASFKSLIAESGDLLPEFLALARPQDMAIMAQRDAYKSAPSSGRDFPENVTMALGRPVMLVPYIGAPEGFGKHVMIAYDGGRESIRAVSDATAFIEGADEVTVLTIGDGDRAQMGKALVEALKHHNPNVKGDHLPSNHQPIASIILSRLADLGSDLLVMGCYGRSRLRELILGGVTREIFHSATVPVFMTH